MKILFIIILIILLMPKNSGRSHGGCNVKSPNNTPRPNAHPAPQPKVTP